MENSAFGRLDELVEKARRGELNCPVRMAYQCPETGRVRPKAVTAQDEPLYAAIFEAIRLDGLQRDADPMRFAGEVYLARSAGLYKIGKSGKTSTRMKSFQTPQPVDLVCAIKTNDMHALEKQLHAKYATSRKRGEWFDLNEEAVAEIIALSRSGMVTLPVETIEFPPGHQKEKPAMNSTPIPQFPGGVAALVPVPFGPDMMLAAQAIDGTPWVSLRRCCESLGLDYASQYQRLTDANRCPWATVVTTTTVAGDDKPRGMILMHQDTLPMWLATISVNRILPECRGRVVAYQKDAARVLADHFFGRKQLQGEIAPLTQAITALAQNMMAMVQQQERMVGTLETLSRRQDETERRLEAVETGRNAPVPYDPNNDPFLTYENEERYGVPVIPERVTNADKRRRVLEVLATPAGRALSDHAIAARCGVSHPFVGRVRRTQGEPRTVRRAGKTYTMDVQHIGPR
jgi:hypothetical protein